MATSKVTLKLLINTTEHKVLFAEAGKDFVDFLFYIFSLPVGTIVMLLKNKPMVGCLGDLYQSIETLNETYIEPNQKKNSVLNPKFPVCPSKTPLMLPDNQSKTGYFYMCPNRHSYVADVPNLPCDSPTCKLPMTQQLTYVSLAAAEAETGFVKDVVTYMVMDNLEVMPMSTISCITLINRFNVKDLGSLEEKVVDFGVDEDAQAFKTFPYWNWLCGGGAGTMYQYALSRSGKPFCALPDFNSTRYLIVWKVCGSGLIEGSLVMLWRCRYCLKKREKK